jgi:hypothetical protein
MTNPIGINPAIMVTRIAQREGASLNTQLAKVAQLRAQMLAAQAEQATKPNPADQALAHPANGAELDLLI